MLEAQNLTYQMLESNFNLRLNEFYKQHVLNTCMSNAESRLDLLYNLYM